MRNNFPSRSGSIYLLLSCLAVSLSLGLQSCYVTGPAVRVPPTDEELSKLDPYRLVDVYWDAALSRDVETIKKIVGPFPDSMLWACPDSEDLLRSRPASGNANSEDLRFDIPGEGPTDKAMHLDNQLNNVLRWAKTIGIANRNLAVDYDVTKKEFGTEAKMFIRPKESPNPYNSYVLFLQKNGVEWKIVDMGLEDYATLVGNKKFGEPRECPPSAQETRSEN